MDSIKNGTGIKNKKTGTLGCINNQFPHNGEDTNWLIVTCYHVCIIGKNRMQYINHDDLIKKWDIITDKEYWILYNKIWNAKNKDKKS